MEDVGFQLEQVFKDIDPAQRAQTVHPAAMSPEETLAHLAEAYVAFTTEARGGKHEWGSLHLDASSWDELWAKFKALRNEAVEIASSSDDEKMLKHAWAYIVAHDAYHVGQIASFRVGLDTAWDPYSMYRM